MIKGIQGHGYHDELVVPIIENTPYEYELTDSLSEAVLFRLANVFSSYFFRTIDNVDHIWFPLQT